jgi:hypothetical protein
LKTTLDTGVIEMEEISNEELAHIIAHVTERDLPEEGHFMMQVGDELIPAEFRAGKDKKGRIYIKTRENMLKSWVTAHRNDHLFAELIRAFIEQEKLDTNKWFRK